jgi:hypothetical protein
VLKVHSQARACEHPGPCLYKLLVATLALAGGGAATSASQRRGAPPGEGAVLDELSPSVACPPRSRCPGGRLVVLEGCGHGLLWEKPDEINQYALAFFTSTPRRV